MRVLYLSFTTVILTAIGVAPSALLTSRHVVHEARAEIPPEWIKTARLASDEILPMRIGLQQSNIHRGEELMMEVSRHTSPKYGKWYTSDEIIDLFAPSQETVDNVMQWLEAAGIQKSRIGQSANKQWLMFDATVEEAERVLKAEYNYFEHESSGRIAVACQEYSVPAHIREHVDYITPGVKHVAEHMVSTRKRSMKMRRRSTNVAERKEDLQIQASKVFPRQELAARDSTPDLSNCSTLVRPECIFDLYNMSSGTTATPGNELGIYAQTSYYFAQNLQAFFRNDAPYIPEDTQPTILGIDGGDIPSTGLSSTETDLDLIISYPLVWPQVPVVYQTDDPVYNKKFKLGDGLLNNMLNAIDGSYCTFSAYGQTGNTPGVDYSYPHPVAGGYNGTLQCGIYKPPTVISVSYAEQEVSLPTNYQQRQCAEIMKLGMQGVSVVVGSGDNGVAGLNITTGQPFCLGDGTVYSPGFPASCPWLTTVGGTQIVTQSPPVEVVATAYGVGGGFSNIYERPSYQSAAVDNYFATANPPYKYYSTSGTNNPDSTTTNGGVYNRAGRAYPDVAAVSEKILSYSFGGGLQTKVQGTSCSTPIFASMLTRINEERLAAGKTTVGFVNTVLYEHPEVFRDIVSGNNTGCGTAGFSAAKGWDPVTGLGTPNYEALLDVFMGLP